MSQADRQILAQKIRKAFKGVKPPGRKIGDKDELRDWLGKTWKDVAIKDINSNSTLIFFSFQGVQYYLPIYLITFLEQSAKISHGVIDDIIRDLGGYDEIPPQATRRLCEFFTDAQKEVILEFLEHYEELFPPQEIKIEAMSRGLQNLAKQKKAERDRQRQQAIAYWSECMRR
jgi:hypothetical protein